MNFLIQNRKNLNDWLSQNTRGKCLTSGSLDNIVKKFSCNEFLTNTPQNQNVNIYRPRTKYKGKVLFSQVSVCPRGEGGLYPPEVDTPVAELGVPLDKVGNPIHPSKDLLHGGRYASCVHAGGLSCADFFFFCCATRNELVQP